MFRLLPADARAPLAKAARARERATSSTTHESREFWQTKEAEWLRLADSAALGERLNAFLATRR